MDPIVLRTSPDVYADPSRQAERSRASVASEMATLPSRVLSADEETRVRIDAAEVLGAAASAAGKRRLSKMLVDHGYAVLSLPEELWAPISATFAVWREFCESLTGEQKWACVQDHDSAGYAEVPGLFEQYNFVMQGGLGTPREATDRARWPVRRDLTAGISSERTIGERDERSTAYPWPPGDFGAKFRATMVDYYAAMSTLGRSCVEAALTGLGVDVSQPAVRALFDASPLPDGTWSNADVKAFRYYRIGADGDEDRETQVGEIHVDIGLMTLIPLATTPGLQALDKSLRVWADLERSRRERDVLIFPSDVFRILTGGYLAGTVHRVLRHSAMERLSIPFILRPPHDCPIAPLPRGGTAFEADSAVNERDCVPFARYDPEFRIDSFAHVIPSVRSFAYLLGPKA